jgi:antitoxin MazE
MYIHGGNAVQTKSQKWGNSLGLRIPKSFAAEARVEAGSTVDLSVEDGDLIIKPVRRLRYDLRDLLKAVNSRNVHREVETGDPVGREAW